MENDIKSYYTKKELTSALLKNKNNLRNIYYTSYSDGTDKEGLIVRIYLKALEPFGSQIEIEKNRHPESKKIKAEILEHFNGNKWALK